LCELGHEVVAYDIRSEPSGVDGVRRARSEAAALEGANAAVVASPPSEHLRQARLALDSGVHVLVEKPFAPSADGVAALGELARERSLVLGAAMNLRLHPGVATVRRLVLEGAIGQPLRASIWCGSWLPGWRPGVDYRDTYSAQKRLGGGVLLDAIHELDYAIWMLGSVHRVHGLLAQSSSLELDVEDIAALVLEHVEGAVTSLTLDYLDRARDRGCRIVGEEGTVSWRVEEETVVRYSAAGETQQIAAPSDVRPTYRTQLERFLSAVTSGGPPTTNATEAAITLTVADAARRASRTRAAVEVLPADLGLRRATDRDADLLLRWRNDPIARAASFDTKEIRPAEHRAWLEQKLADPGTRLLVATTDGVPVGQLRLEVAGKDVVELHIALAPEARRRGLAPPLIVLAAHEHAPALGAARLLARIKPGNEPSRRAFIRAGFHICARSSQEWQLELALPR
jgi:predicted dehydrogenase/RimJ/RimL family protein N-acetyltransferase